MSIRAFGRLRVGNAPPLISGSVPAALKVGELVASRQGVLYLGIGAGTGTNATDYVTFNPFGTAGLGGQQLGTLVFSDMAAQNSTNPIMLRCPQVLTLTGMSVQTGGGSCSVEISSSSKTFSPSVSATTTVAHASFAGNSVQRRVEVGESILLTISNATDLTSLVVQLDWEE